MVRKWEGPGLACLDCREKNRKLQEERNYVGEERESKVTVLRANKHERKGRSLGHYGI